MTPETRTPTVPSTPPRAHGVPDFAEVLAAPAATPRLSDGRARQVLVCFAVTLFVSATLLFLVQPMVGKMILPMFGGTPAVWNTCMVFFQAALLAGYAYAHATTSWFGVKRQTLVHAVVLLSPLVVLPIAIGTSARPPTTDQPVFWLLWRLLLCVGLPFFVVSTTSPLLQKWFAGTGHPDARDPYFLYAASNVGSLLALLGYPLILQPAMTLAAQSRLWTAGYVMLVMMILVCALIVWRAPAAAGVVQLRSQARLLDTSIVPMRRRMWWIFTAFVPSSLMLGVTAHITSNLAPVPLLWVLPLAIYLFTMVLVFARRTWIPQAWMARALPFLVLPVILVTFLELPAMAWIAIVAHLVTFFVAAMVCHGELARSRPAARHLTEFYLWMSVGGVLGGIFNAIVAPSIFTVVAEYPLAIVLACFVLCRSDKQHEQPSNVTATRRMDVILPVGLAVLAGVSIAGVYAAGLEHALLGRALMFVPAAIVCFSFKDRPLRFALGFTVITLAIAIHANYSNGKPLYAGRNFFGVKRVVLDPSGEFHMFVHGTTYHGIQNVDPKKSREPLAYYHRTGPIGDVFRACTGPLAKTRIGAVGLGAGSVASYAVPGQHITFFEIDPEVARIASDPQYFSFLSQCRGSYDIVIGDGRLTIADVPDHAYGLIILDAFSSDAIPTHLLTREALQLYVRKLKPDGVMAFHISNGYLDLQPLLGALAAEAGLESWARDDLSVPNDPELAGKSPSRWVIMAHAPEHIGTLADDPDWEPLHAPPGFKTWTDQNSSLLPIFRWH